MSLSVDIRISCTNLPNMDIFSLTDPVCRVFLFDAKTKQFVKIGTTENLYDTLNPAFNTRIRIKYADEEEQLLKFVIEDDDNTHFSLVGEAQITLEKIMNANDRAVSMPIENPKLKKNGTINISAKVVHEKSVLGAKFVLKSYHKMWLTAEDKGVIQGLCNFFKQKQF